MYSVIRNFHGVEHAVAVNYTLAHTVSMLSAEIGRIPGNSRRPTLGADGRLVTPAEPPAAKVPNVVLECRDSTSRRQS